MTNTVARIKRGSLHFEILVDLDDALKFKKGLSDFLMIESNAIFTDLKKGNRASSIELQDAFGTKDILEIGKEIVKYGEILIDQEHRDEEKERKIKQVVDFLARNAIDPRSGNPITAERIKTALNETQTIIKNVPVENQIQNIIDSISRVLPIKIETRKIKVTIPAIQTGKAYGIIAQYKEKENWLNDGSLEAILNIPAGILIDFYEQLNSATHGSAITQELKN